MKTSELIDRLYESTGINAKKVVKKYLPRAAVFGGLAAGAALAMSPDEKKLLADSVSRNQERYPEYDDLHTMASKTLLPAAVGSIGGLAIGAVLGKRGLGKKTLAKAMANEKSEVIRPLLKAVDKKYGSEKLRMAGGALAGYAVGDKITGTPFEIGQAKNDYKAGLKRYDGNKLRAGVSATSPWTMNLGLYGAEKMHLKQGQ